MAFDTNLHSTPKSFPAFLTAPANVDLDDAISAFEDRLWSAAETAIAAGAPSIAIVAVAASLVRRQSETFASILSGAEYMSSLGEDAGPQCSKALGGDIAAAQDRLIRRLQEDLASL